MTKQGKQRLLEVSMRICESIPPGREPLVDDCERLFDGGTFEYYQGMLRFGSELLLTDARSGLPPMDGDQFTVLINGFMSAAARKIINLHVREIAQKEKKESGSQSNPIP